MAWGIGGGYPPLRAVRGFDGTVWTMRLRHGVLLLLIGFRARAEPASPVVTSPTVPPAPVVVPPAVPPPSATAPPAPAPTTVPPATLTAAPAAQAPGSPAPATSAAGPSAPAPGLTDPVVAASIAFRRGDELFVRGHYEAALVEYERAYHWLPVYNVLYNIGAANARLQRWAAARRAFAAYVELGGAELPPERVEEVRQYIEVLRQKTATVSLLLNVPDAEVHIDGVRVAPTEISGLVVEPGEHVVRVTKPGFRPLEQVLQAATGENLRVVLPLARVSTLGPPAPIASGALTVALEPLPARGEPEPTPLWVPWTLTGVLAAGWLTTAALAIQARHDRDTIEQPQTPQHRIDSARRLHIGLAVASDVLLAATLVSGGVSAYLTWWPRETTTPAAGLGPVPIRGIGAGVSGRF